MLFNFNSKHMALWRLFVQSVFLGYSVWIGFRFYMFYLWATGNSAFYIPRPASVEAFLPISALLGLKRFVLTGNYDPVHPAGLTILIWVLLTGFFLRKGFCGWVCPVGAVSNLLERVSKKFGVLTRVPAWLDYPLLCLKYLLLAFFMFIILWKMDLRQVDAFILTPYNLAADSKMLRFFVSPSGLTLSVLAALFIISFFVRNFWCRYLCPYGALLGIIAMTGPVSVHRDESKCINCLKCEKTCPGSIAIASKTGIKNCECVGCLECIAICPVDDCLTLKSWGNRAISPHWLPLAVIAMLFFLYAVAVFTGHWETHVPVDMLKKAVDML